MANAKQVETSLLTEHLRYTPLTILDDIINTVNLLVNRAVDAVETGLLTADPETLGFAERAAAEHAGREADEYGQDFYPEMRPEIEEGVHKLETLLATNVDRNFDKFEIFALRNIFAVEPDLVPWVRLGHYQDLNLPSPASSDPNITPESLRLLRRKLQETRKLHSALAAEKARNDALLSQLRSLITPQTTKTEPQSSPASMIHSSSTVTAPPDSVLSFLTSTLAART
ncbi:hypothetical protein NA57DRAFT_22339, partial [Rhizodiscina lignyota]